MHTINGTGRSSAQAFPVINPSTGATYAMCPDASREQVDEVVAAAAAAYPSWRRTGVTERRACLHRFAQALELHHESIAEVLTSEQGKPLKLARDEVLRAARNMRALTDLDLQDEFVTDSTGRRVEIIYRPLGVVAAITPWNMPVAMAVAKIAHALYTGNTVVLKPSPYTPLATLMLGRIGADIFPPGVLNVIAGGDELGRWICEHPGVAKVSFTGSGPTGRKVMASAAVNLTRVTLELGGNDAAIVMADVDPAEITQRLFDSAFMNAGQICMAIKRLYVHEAVYGPICDGLAEIAKKTRVGDGFDPATQMGPVQNAAQFKIVTDILEDTRRVPGARILSGGVARQGGGYFLEPTVVADVKEGCRLVDEEPFGPILPVIRFTDVDDAIARANATPYGLGGSVWSREVEAASKVARQLDAGVTWVNGHIGLDPHLPFGGRKASGLGREYSLAGLRSYMEATTFADMTPPRNEDHQLETERSKL